MKTLLRHDIHLTTDLPCYRAFVEMPFQQGLHSAFSAIQYKAVIQKLPRTDTEALLTSCKCASINVQLNAAKCPTERHRALCSVQSLARRVQKSRHSPLFHVALRMPARCFSVCFIP